jgi:hypothetical protein
MSNQIVVKKKKQANKPKVAKSQPKKNLIKTPKKNGENNNRKTNEMRSVLSKSSRTREFMEYAEAIALPKESHPIRLSSAYSTGATALANPWAMYSQTSNGGSATASAQLARTEGMAFAFRDVERAFVLYDPNPAGQAYTYGAYFKSQTLGNAPTTNIPAALIPTGTRQLNPCYWAFTGIAYAPHGPTLYCGALPGNSALRFTWVDINAVVTTTVTSVPLLDSLRQFRYRWDNGQEIFMGYADAAGGGPGVGVARNFVCTASAYWRFEYQVIVTATGVIDTTNAYDLTSMSIGGSASVFRHLAMPFLENNYLSVQGTRINAVSLMLTNQASPLYRQGKVVALQSPQDIEWTDYINGGFDEIQRSKMSCVLKADNGIYGFLKPTKPADFDFNSHLDCDNGILMDSHYPLPNNSAYLVMAFSIANNAAAAETSTPGQDLYWTVAFGIEYQTADVWRQVGESDISPEMCEKALQQLKEIPQFHENPLHLAAIWQRIKAIAGPIINGIVKYVPQIASAVGTLASML